MPTKIESESARKILRAIAQVRRQKEEFFCENSSFSSAHPPREMDTFGKTQNR
jgi:hypothetical protein